MKYLKRIYNYCIKTLFRKVLSVILIILILLSSIKFVFLKPNTVLADSLFTFNEGYGSSINDNNGNVTAGTIANAVWKQEDLCKEGKCLYFDGTGDKITFADDADLDFVAADNFTIEGWFRTPDITSGQRTLIAKHNATAGGYKVYIDSNGYLIFGVDDDSTWTPDDSVSTTTTAFDDNKWHFFSAVKTGTTSITIYVDNIQYQTDSSIAATGTLANSDSLLIGIDGDGSSNGFSGFIDEVKIYRSARTAAEIKTDYLDETPSRGVTASFGPDNSWISNGLVGYWKMDETSGNAIDSSGNSNTGINKTAGATGGTITYSGGYTIHTFTSSGTFTPSYSESVEYLVVGGGGGGGGGYYAGGGGAGGYRNSTSGETTGGGGSAESPLSVTAQAYTITVGAGGAGGAIATVGTNGGDSVFSTITATGGGGGGKYSNNGITGGSGGGAASDDGGSPNTGGTASSPTQGYAGGDSSGAIVGAGGGGGAGAIGANGGSDYGGAGGAGLSSSITGSAVTRGGGGGGSAGDIAGRTGGDGGTGGGGRGGDASTNNNAAGTANTGGGGGGNSGAFAGQAAGSAGGSGIVIIRYLTGAGPTTISGKFGNSGDFELSNSEYLSTADNASLSLTGNLTLSAWIKPETVTAGTYNIISKWDGSNESYRLMQNADEIRIELDSNGNYVETTASNLAAGTWYHVVGIYSPTTSTAKVYINGSEATSTTTGTIPSSIGDDAGGFQIGAEDLNNTPKNFYDGVIDDVRLYNRALSPAEVSKLYNFAPGPIAYYKMDENTGTTTTYDSSGTGSNATLTDFTDTPSRWVPGKYGSALKFDGSDDYANFYSSGLNSLFVGAQGTAMVWVKVSNSAVWTDGQTGVILKMGPDVDNTVTFQKNTSNLMQMNYIAGATQNSASLTITPTDWFHIAISWDKAADQIKYYYNGVLTEIDTGLGTWAGALSSTRTSFGNNYNGTTGWDGMLDDLKIYNYPRSSGQIVEDMNAEHPAPGSPVGSAVAYWKFDEGYGTTANDNSINANNLTLSTASWTNSGKFGKAFNGLTNARASRATDPDLEFSATEDFTISLWYKSDSANNPAATEYLMASGGPAGSAGYAIYANTSDNLCFGIDDDTSWGPDVASCTTTDVYDNTWHHVTAVRNVATDTTKIYLDAVEKDSDTDSTTTTLDSSPTFYIGDANATDGTDEFLGDIDEVKVFRSALTSDAIKVLYNQSSQASLGALSTDSSNNPSNSDTNFYCPPGQGSACVPPIIHLKMDENTGTSTTYDSSTNNSNAAFTGSPSWATGKYGSGITLNGSSQWMEVASPGLPTGDFTYEIWANAISYASATFFMASGSGGTGNELIIAKGGTLGLRVTLNSTTDVLSVDNILSINNWQHIAVTRSGSSINAYINGVLVATGTNGDTLDFGSCQLLIGMDNDGASCNGTSSDYFNGTLDNAVIYNYARTPAQVAWDYNRGSPVGWWKLDENTGILANDSMGNSTAGTLTNTPTWVTGKFNQGLTFAGSDQHVLIADDPDFDFADDESMTLTTWFKHGAASAQEVILSKYADAGYKIIMEANGDITCGLDYDSTWTPTDSATSTAATYDDGSWHHIACIKTGATSLALYIDGVLIATDSSITATNTLTNADPLYLGIDADGTSKDFTGSLDDARIYRYPLSIQQIKTIMNNGSAVKF